MKGFTLIEVLIVIFIFVLSVGVLTGLIFWAYKTQSYILEQTSAIDSATKGVEIMIRELREATYGDDGSYPLEKAEDKEIIFYSDIDKDDETERVRYFLGGISSKDQVKECVSYSQGGLCEVVFSNFYQGILKSAQIKISVEGDFGATDEYAEIFLDGQKLNNICQTGCTDCAGVWQGISIFDVINQANDNYLQLLVDSTLRVDPICQWQNPNHSMKVNFELSWIEEIPSAAHELKKGVINPIGSPVIYPSEQEEVSVLSSYIRNNPPIFEYYDASGNKITDYPARLIDTKLMKVYLVVNVDPNRPPDDFELESWVQIRNLKTEQ